jgi:hypothetical protein
MTDPTDRQAGVEQVTISLPKRGLPAPANHQIPVSTKQMPNLVEITTEMKQVIRKKVFLHQEKNLIRADRNPVTNLCGARRVVAHSRAEAQKAGQKGVLVMNRQVKREATLQEEKLRIQAGQPQKTDQNEALVMNRQVKREATLQEEKLRIRAGQPQKTDQKGVLVMSRQVKRKAFLQKGKLLIQANRHRKADQKEVSEVNLLKGNLSVNQASKAVKNPRIKNLTAVHQKIQDISHFANRPTHHTISLHSEQSAAQKINRYEQGRNLPKRLV